MQTILPIDGLPMLLTSFPCRLWLFALTSAALVSYRAAVFGSRVHDMLSFSRPSPSIPTEAALSLPSTTQSLHQYAHSNNTLSTSKPRPPSPTHTSTKPHLFTPFTLSLRQALGLRARELRLVGGGSKNVLWQQIVADVFQLPVRCAPVHARARARACVCVCVFCVCVCVNVGVGARVRVDVHARASSCACVGVGARVHVRAFMAV
jgi:hypothetical protein